MKKTTIKRFFSATLALIMVLSLVPFGVLSVFAAEEPSEYVLDATKDLQLFDAGTKADGDTVTAGTEDYFTLICSTKTKVDGSEKTFDDGYTATQRINFGGSTQSGSGMINSVKITTSGAADIKLWWVSGGDGRRMAVCDASGNVIVSTEASESVKNSLYISQLRVESAGNYYISVPDGSNYLFKIQVVEGEPTDQPERADWETVAAPVITEAKAEDGQISVTVTADVSRDGGDAVVVTMYDAKGNEIDSKRSIAEKAEHTLTFSPDASGTYTFVAVLSRDGEADKASDSAEVSFVLPLKAPYICSATSTGGGKVNIVWEPVAEAEKYEVYCDDTFAGETDATEYEVSGLTVGTTYSFTVIAIRGEDRSEASAAAKVEVTEEAQIAWGFTTYGPSTNTSDNGYVVNDDGTVTVFSENGKGKIVPASTDGVAFYYTAIPTEYNFTLKATVTVDSWTFTNGQEGFGLLATDRLGPNGSSAAVWNNQYMASVTKNEYTSEAGIKYSMKLGVNTIAKTGATPENLPKLEENDSETVQNDFSSVSTTLENYAAEQGQAAGTYNIVGNYTKDPGGTILELTEFVLEIQRNNTGYFITYYDADGNIIGQVKNYDPNALSHLDSENVYAGFFASRNARITVSNVELTTILASEDAPAEEHPVTYVTPEVAITSASTANSENYTVYINANVDGTAAVSVNGTTVAEDVAVTGGERCDVETVLTVGSNEVVVTFAPDPDQVLGEFTELTSTDPITASITVSFLDTWQNQKNLYVSPDGTAEGKGTKNSPLDIYTAVSNARPGQKIILMEGTYELTRTLRIEHGIDGTEDAYIYMIADPEASSRPVLDFQGACAGIVHGGDYWYFQGFDVTRSKDGEKGFQLSGHYNVLDQINTYRNGNTGIQISRYSSYDPKSEWPSYNTILNCTSHNNADPGYEDADGFACKLTAGEGNVFDGCLAYHNADDGWDLYAKVESGSIGAVTIINSVAYENGYIEGEDGTLINAGNGNGFKMGGESLSGEHTLINSYSFFNKAKGFDSNSCPDIIVQNSTSYNNESYNVAFYTNNAPNTNFIASGIISFKDSTIKTGFSTGENLKHVGSQDTDLYLGDTNYYWDGSASKNASGEEITADMFVSLVFQGVDRNENGTLNLHGFLELKDDIGGIEAGAVPGGTPSEAITVEPDSPESVEPTPVEPPIWKPIWKPEWMPEWKPIFPGDWDPSQLFPWLSHWPVPYKN